METKTCTDCGVKYPATVEFFRKRKGGRYGVGAKCWPCERKRAARSAREKRRARGSVPRPSTNEIRQFWDNVPDLFVGYLAGLVDGEGCIYIGRTYAKALCDRTPESRQYLFLSVSITSTTLMLMCWLKDNFGGSFRSKKPSDEKYKECYGWRLVSNQAAGFLERILPLLIVKREQAEIAIEFQSRISGNHANAVTDEEMSYRLSLKEQIEDLR